MEKPPIEGPDAPLPSSFVEWNVFVNGVYVGEVAADTASRARITACSDFDIDDESSITVVER